MFQVCLRELTMRVPRVSRWSCLSLDVEWKHWEGTLVSVASIYGTLSLEVVERVSGWVERGLDACLWEKLFDLSCWRTCIYMHTTGVSKHTTDFTRNFLLWPIIIYFICDTHLMGHLIVGCPILWSRFLWWTFACWKNCFSLVGLLTWGNCVQFVS